MNKVILLDGTYGVGKTSVANYICSAFDDRYICIEPDEYFNNNRECYFFWGWPASNNSCLKGFIRKEAEKKIQTANIIIPLTLNDESYVVTWTKLFSDIAEVKHVILFAETEKMKSRIINDTGRDKNFALEQLKYSEVFYRQVNDESIQIDTSELSIEEVAIKVLEVIN